MAEYLVLHRDHITWPSRDEARAKGVPHQGNSDNYRVLLVEPTEAHTCQPLIDWLKDNALLPHLIGCASERQNPCDCGLWDVLKRAGAMAREHARQFDEGRY